MLGQNRVTPSIKFASTHFKLGWKEAKNTTWCPRPLLKPGRSIRRQARKLCGHHASRINGKGRSLYVAWFLLEKKHVEINAHISLVRGCISGNTQCCSLMDDTSSYILKATWKEFPTVSLREGINWLMCDFIPRTLPRYLIGWISIAV